MNSDTCLLHTHAHCHTHPRSALPGFDNYFQLHRGSGAVEGTVEDIMKTRGRETKRKKKREKKVGGWRRPSIKRFCLLYNLRF